MAIGYQAVQSGHAVAEFIFENPAEASKWHSESNYLIFLSTDDERSLHRLKDRLKDLEVSVSSFYEPDIGNELTAIAFVSDERTKRLTSGIPLQGKGC